jgi:tetratricopeptide (TPR) repeat protein
MHKAFAIFVLTALPGSAGPAALEQARQLYERTEYDTALKLLLPLKEKDGPALALIGKAYFRKKEFKKASDFLQQAVAADPSNSAHQHWLGKAFGRRAEASSFLTAPHYASKCRKAFETAVELNPGNLEAMNDLFSYYLEAPGFLGGGFDKAAALAERIGELDQAEYHYAQAQLAKKRKQYAAAEEHLRRAIDLAPGQVGRLIDLAKFLAERGRVEESDTAFQRARQIAPDSAKVLFETARTYLEGNRNLAAARELLEQYVSSSLTPEDPPREQAEELLDKHAPQGAASAPGTAWEVP